VVSETGEIIRNLILGDVADDYEEFDHVVKTVTSEAAERGISVDRQEILDKLGDLVNEGCVQSFLYLADQNSFAKVAEYSADRIDDLWFYIAPKGLLIFKPSGEAGSHL
jgi:hypothetical protein